MASSNAWRVHVQCGGCGAQAWIGPAARGWDAWCECCQQPSSIAGGEAEPPATPCPRCGTPLTTGAPRFSELGGELQHLAAVLAGAECDPAPLRTLLPERPRLLGDLDPPPARPGDPAELRGALEALAEGRFRDALASLEPAATGAHAPHALRALAIAHARAGDPKRAEAAWNALLERGEDAGARLNRGVLRAARNDLDAALADFARAGDTREARWNRAATALTLAVGRTPGLPDTAVIETAREEAGEASSYWSDFTVGRLLWALLLERALARRDAGGADCPDHRVMRAAETLFEFDTFWDRAQVLHGYAALGMRSDASRVGLELAQGILGSLAGEPWARWGEGPLARSVDAVRAALGREGVAAARAALEPLRGRDDVAHHRMPCRHCAAGAVGVDAMEEAGHAR